MRRHHRQLSWKQIATLVSLAAIVVLAAGGWWVFGSGSAAKGAGLSQLAARVQLRPDDEQAQLAYGEALVTSGDLPAAVHAFSQAAHLAPGDARPYTWLGMLALKDHKPDYAIANFARSAMLDPTDADVWRALGRLYAQRHWRRHAKEAFGRLVRLDPADEVAWRSLGVLQSQANLLAAGYESLQRAVALNPNDEEAQVDLGRSALTIGKLSVAKQAFDRALAHKPEDPAAIAGEAEAALQLDPSPAGLARAAQLARQSLDRQPSARAHLVLGRVQLAGRQYDAAVRELKQATALDPEQLTAYGYLSQAYAALGDTTDAHKAAAQSDAVRQRILHPIEHAKPEDD